jgi:hypothetical protein
LFRTTLIDTAISKLPNPLRAPSRPKGVETAPEVVKSERARKAAPR